MTLQLGFLVGGLVGLVVVVAVQTWQVHVWRSAYKRTHDEYLSFVRQTMERAGYTAPGDSKPARSYRTREDGLVELDDGTLLNAQGRQVDPESMLPHYPGSEPQ